MRYRERGPRSVSLGCLPAAVFGVVTAFPATFVVVMGECVGQDGLVRNCPNEGTYLLLVIGATAALCALITWATNRMVAALVAQGRSAAWGVVAGFALSAVLLLLILSGFGVLP